MTESNRLMGNVAVIYVHCVVLFDFISYSKCSSKTQKEYLLTCSIEPCREFFFFFF